MTPTPAGLEGAAEVAVDLLPAAFGVAMLVAWSILAYNFGAFVERSTASTPSSPSRRSRTISYIYDTTIPIWRGDQYATIVRPSDRGVDLVFADLTTEEARTYGEISRVWLALDEIDETIEAIRDVAQYVRSKDSAEEELAEIAEHYQGDLLERLSGDDEEGSA